jgi:hypothetical protein
MENTPVNVLKDLEEWADNDKAPRVCRVNGMAGIGKSHIAVTFSERMDKKLKLGTSFVCSDSCPTHVSSCLLLHICLDEYPSGSAICEVLRRNPVASDTLVEQFYLFSQFGMTNSVERNKSVVVMDNLDACADQSTVIGRVDPRALICCRCSLKSNLWSLIYRMAVATQVKFLSDVRAELTSRFREASLVR